jgi:hypothetical protein
MKRATMQRTSAMAQAKKQALQQPMEQAIQQPARELARWCHHTAQDQHSKASGYVFATRYFAVQQL